MNYYRVQYAKTHRGEFYVTQINVGAIDRGDAEKKVEKLCKPDNIVSVVKVGDYYDHVLDLWYGMDSVTYMSEWEPNITTLKMINRLKKYPSLRKALLNG